MQIRTYDYLTLSSLTWGYFFSGISSFLPKKKPTPPGIPWKCVSIISSSEEEKSSQIGVYTDGKRKVIIKSLQYSLRTLLYRHIKNEASILHTYENIRHSIPQGTIRLPQLIDMRDTGHTIHIMSEYCTGKDVSTSPISDQMDILSGILSFFSTCYQSKKSRAIPRRPTWVLACAYPMAFLRASRKHSDLVWPLLQQMIRSYAGFISACTSPHTVAHRDIHGKNILRSRKEIVIIDPETCVSAARETDIAIIAEYFISIWGETHMEKFLLQHLNTAREVKAFSFLATYYAMVSLAVLPPDHSHARHVRSYIQSLENIVSRLCDSKEKTTL